MLPKWKRPESVPFPSVWRRFEGRKAFPNGKKPRFRVQDYTEEWWEDLLDNMKNHFLVDEPLAQSLNVRDDKEAMLEIECYWKEFTKHKLVLVCLLENKEELEDDSLPTLVGCNITGVVESDSPHLEGQSKSMKTIFAFLDYLNEQVNCFNVYGASVAIYALGLSVNRIFRGQGIGLEILKARFDMGRAVGLGFTFTVFTAIHSQRLAEEVGFETVLDLPYTDYKVEGEIVFKNMPTRTCKVMAARIT